MNIIQPLDQIMWLRLECQLKTSLTLIPPNFLCANLLYSSPNSKIHNISIVLLHAIANIGIGSSLLWPASLCMENIASSFNISFFPFHFGNVTLGSNCRKMKAVSSRRMDDDNGGRQTKVAWRCRCRFVWSSWWKVQWRKWLAMAIACSSMAQVSDIGIEAVRLVVR